MIGAILKQTLNKSTHILNISVIIIK